MLYGLLGIVIIILLILLFRKHVINVKEETTQKVKLQKELEVLRHEKELLDDVLAHRDEAINKANENYKNRLTSIGEELRSAQAQRQKELDEDFDILLRAKQQVYNKEVQEYDRLRLQSLTDIWDDFQADINSYSEQVSEYENRLNDAHAKYDSIIEPIRLLEKEQQEKLFYCINVPEKDRDDIQYLTEFVADKIHNKDLIPKLIWQEYIQKSLQDTLKRVGIKDEPGIYKITNIETNKCYIGKSTKVRQRLIDHVKGALGISSIADQTIHHAMMEEGLWNWMFECVCTCDKEQLGEKEKYYISFFNTQDFGYNIASGG